MTTKAQKLLADLEQAVIDSTTVQGSAVAFIDGFAARQQTAIDAAIANGATEAELAPVQAEVDALVARKDELAAAILRNTPAAPPTP